MARKLRIEYEGAMYHVINRGNYRADVFETAGAKEAFEGCLYEACAKAGWKLHAFVVMRNHYHLALETPEANLVAGMKWLQSTYANRFNRFRNERGHVFQGRYQAIVVEDTKTLGAVGHYIHLNPVRAGVVSMKTLPTYRHGSYRYLWTKRDRPDVSDFSSVLMAAGGLEDTCRGWERYEAYLAWLQENEPARKALAFEKMCKGWVLGSAAFKRALVEDHKERLQSPLVESETKELREAQWEQALQAALKALGQTSAAVAKERKSQDWKVAIATHLRQITTATNPWLAARLHMGKPGALSRYVVECKSGLRPPALRYLEKLKNVKSAV